MAFESMRLAYKDYPPTLFEFVSLCRDARTRRALNVPKLAQPVMPTDAKVLGELAMLVRHMKEGTKDPRDWARKIIKRIESGEPMPTISERFAKEALGMDGA